jgi:hypothetical protein
VSCGAGHHGKTRDSTIMTLPPNRNPGRGRYRLGVQRVSNRSKVFRIALRLSVFACGQNFDVESLYSTWKTAFVGAKYVV